MTYSPLSQNLERFKDFPLILCGPILRKVDRSSVTVWVALKDPRPNVKLTIYDDADNAVLTGATRTRQIGVHIHIAAVTARLNTTILVPGKLYHYDLEFNSGERLATDGVFGSAADFAKSLCYGSLKAPSFVSPPSNWKDLHFLHGSCRKIHAPGLDALPAVDVAIRQSAQDPVKRPQFLLLTGDQIYADDVADAVLTMLIDVGSTVLGQGVETLPGLGANDVLDPGKRTEVVEKKIFLTSSEAKSHLLRFSEFCAMYLFSWSGVLWPKTPSDVPEFEEVFPGESRKKLVTVRGEPTEIPTQHFTTFTAERNNVKRFAATLGAVRRALANIPTHMILDDHEITDDWYLSANWCVQVLGNDAGRRVICNGLAAYAMFQGWGNTPERFDVGTSGEMLLDELEKATHNYTVRETCLNIPPQNQIFNPTLPTPQPGKDVDLTQALPKGPTLYHDEKSGASSPRYLTWDYVLNFETYQFIILDIRNWRSYPGPRGFFPPSPLSDDAFERQIIENANPPLGTTPELTFVVTPDVPLGIPVIELFQITRRPASILSRDIESWTGQRRAFHLLFAKLANRPVGAAEGPNPPRKRRVVILSGDVHHSYAVRLQYWARTPYEAASFDTQAVFALLTSSAFKNQDWKTMELHQHGYGGPNKPNKVTFLAWENKAKEKLLVAVLRASGNVDLNSVFLWKDSPGVKCLEEEKGAASIEGKLVLKIPSEWRYRVDYLTASVLQRGLPQPAKIGSVDPKKDLALATKAHREWVEKRGPGLEIVGANNVGEITFNLEDTDPTIRIAQKLWFRSPASADPAPNTTHIVSLEYEDLRYPDPESQVILGP